MVARTLLVIPLAVLAAACSSLDQGKPLGEQLDDGDREEFVDGVMQGAGGLLARGEAECWSEAVFESGATPAELERWSADPLQAGGVGMQEALAECVDPGLDVVAPIEGDVEEELVAGLTAGGMTSEQAQCTLDAISAAGLDARDLMIAGLTTEAGDEIRVSLAEIGRACA